MWVSTRFNALFMFSFQAEKTPFSQNQRLSLDLMKKGPHAFHKFIVCLYKSNLEDIGQKLLLTEFNMRHGTSLNSFAQLPRSVKNQYESYSRSGNVFYSIDRIISYFAHKSLVLNVFKGVLVFSRAAVIRKVFSFCEPFQLSFFFP